MYNYGEFIQINNSNYPGIIIKNIPDNNLLVSIVEYFGDYIIINTNNDNINILSLKPHEKLSILSKFNDWFYYSNVSFYQELIIDTINYFKK